MPRKPKKEKRQITVVIHGQPVSVSLHPPKGSRTCWYAYWNGLVSSKSTGEKDIDAAMAVAEHMVRNGGRRGQLADTVLSDEEFVEIQRRHFGKKNDPAAKERAEKSLTSCLEAISAFREISGVVPVTMATPSDCECFQHEALKLPRDRCRRSSSDEDVETLSPNTVLKWSRTLQAAFERANRNSGKKCVRGVADEVRLLTANPWHLFTWIDGVDRPIRQFDDQELVGVIDHLESRWPGVSVAVAFAKTCLWSWGRKQEITGLKWESCRVVGAEVHFEVVGKWGVEKWFRIPQSVHRELLAMRTDSPFVFASYNDQLRRFHVLHGQHSSARAVGTEFSPANLGAWFYRRVASWSKPLPKGAASMHVFRKTTLQYARSGEDVNRQVAADARLSESVMLGHYVKLTDPERRQASNRMYSRICASLAPNTARRYGVEVDMRTSHDIEVELLAAVDAKDWLKVGRLSPILASRTKG